MQQREALFWIRHLRLEPHPEGGYYRETYRSQEAVNSASLPSRYAGSRCFSTAIYFLLEAGSFSAFHRLKSDELWHFHAGSAVLLHVIEPDGACRQARVGSDPEKGEVFQYVIPAGCWFAAHVEDARGFSLMGCTVAPGFDFSDFELASREALTAQFPQHKVLISRLTRQNTRSRE